VVNTDDFDAFSMKKDPTLTQNTNELDPLLLDEILLNRFNSKYVYVKIIPKTNISDHAYGLNQLYSC